MKTPLLLTLCSLTLILSIGCRNESQFKSNVGQTVQEVKNANVYVQGIDSTDQPITQTINDSGTLNLKFDAVGTRTVQSQGEQEKTKVHAVFVMDISNSMQPVLDETRRQMGAVAAALSAEHIDLSASTIGFIDAFSVVTSNTTPFREISESGQLLQFQNDIQGLSGDSSNNREFAEGGLYAISQAVKQLQTTGTSDEVKLIFYVSDAAAHNGSASAVATLNMPRDCNLNGVIDEMSRYANTLTNKDNFRFYYSVKPFEQRDDGHINRCKHTDSTIPDRTGPEQMEIVVSQGGLQGGSIDRRTLFNNSWPAANTELVNNLVDAIKKSVSSVQEQNQCYARSAQLVAGNSAPINLWNTTQISEVLSLQQASNQIELQDVVKKYGINLSQSNNVVINIDRCCVTDLNQAQWGKCDSQFNQKIDVLVKMTN